MLLFLWILGAMGVAYAAQLSRRGGWAWFIVGMVLTPLGGSLALMAANRQGWFLKRR
ncbi:MAG: hypothetical protein JO256_09980 [Alphaproteobacteria bacterium]|nr:hypothetical protein [Alphaproteobacteria bacterium]